MRFVRVIPRELTATPGEFGAAMSAPMAVTVLFAARPRPSVGGQDVSPPDVRSGRGMLETYVCSSCGFVEWYCLDPDAIPIGPEYMSEVVDYDAGEGPYR